MARVCAPQLSWQCFRGYKVNGCAWRDLAGLEKKCGSVLEECRARSRQEFESETQTAPSSSGTSSTQAAAKQRRISPGTGSSKASSSAGAPIARNTRSIHGADRQLCPHDGDDGGDAEEDPTGHDGDADPDPAADILVHAVGEKRSYQGKSKMRTIAEKLDLLKKFDKIKASGVKYPEKAR